MSSALIETMVKAASLQMTGDAAGALAELCHARDEGDQSPKLYCAVGHLHFELGQFEAAARSYQGVLRLNGDDSTAHYNLAVCLEKLGAWEQAAQAFRKAIEKDPRRAGAHLGLGICLLHLQQPQDALDAFERCLDRQPFREAALHGKAAALQFLNRQAEASELYQLLLSRDPHSEELLANTLALAITTADYELVIQCSRRLLEIRPDSAEALECLAFAAAASRDYDGAVRLYKALIESHPNHFAGWFNCGVALQKLGRFQEAADAYSRAAALNPGSSEAYLGLGTVLHELEQWEPAREAYENALALDPALTAAAWNLALLFERKQRLSEAGSLYSKLVERHPEAEDAWFRLGYIRLHLGDFAGCIQALESCPILQKQGPEVLLNMGIAHWKMGNLDLAQETLRQVSTATPTPVEGLRCLLAVALEHKDFEQASALHAQLAELGEPSCELLYNTGLLLQKQGCVPDAVVYYRQALAHRPDFPQALLNLGHALMTLGKPEEAHASWQAALRCHVELAEHFLV